MTDNNELKPCPFCGFSEIKIYNLFYEKYARCARCGAEGPHVNTNEGVIITWNNRANTIDCKSANKTPGGKCLGYQHGAGSIDCDIPIEQCINCRELESYSDFHEEGNND